MRDNEIYLDIGNEEKINNTFEIVCQWIDETVLKETGGEKYERYARAYDEYMESSFIGMMGAEDETGEEICTGMMM